MSHFAQIDNNNIVLQVIVAEQDFIDTLIDKENWIQTSYNTYKGIHYDQNGLPDGGNALRKNYAAIGYVYDVTRDAFIAPKPWDSWILNEETCLWEAPTLFPSDGQDYNWNEEDKTWVLIDTQSLV